MASIANQRGYNSYNNFPRHSNVSVPSSIKCNRCGIVKTKAAFSNGPQADLVQHMRRVGPSFNPTKTGYISCMKCTPQQVVELHCYMCDKDKGLDKFFKTQRRTPDHAVRCLVEQDATRRYTDPQRRCASPVSRTNSIMSLVQSLRTSLTAAVPTTATIPRTTASLTACPACQSVETVPSHLLSRPRLAAVSLSEATFHPPPQQPPPMEPLPSLPSRITLPEVRRLAFRRPKWLLAMALPVALQLPVPAPLPLPKHQAIGPSPRLCSAKSSTLSHSKSARNRRSRRTPSMTRRSSAVVIPTRTKLGQPTRQHETFPPHMHIQPRPTSAVTG